MIIPSSDRLKHLPQNGLIWITTFLWLAHPKNTKGETSLTTKVQSWQEDNGRMRVDSKYAQVDADLSPDTHLKVMGVIDSVTGASPDGQIDHSSSQVPLSSNITDERKAADINLSHQLPRINISGGFSRSEESDYISNGYSLNTLTDFNEKNTLLLLGIAHTDDVVTVSQTSGATRKKKTNDYIFGISQVLDPQTTFTANVGFGKGKGYFSDPYKIVSTTTLVVPFPGFPAVSVPITRAENRPSEKEKCTLFLGANHLFEKLQASAELSYRFYHDDFGINSHTLELGWNQKLGEHFTVETSVRGYRQSAADFYYYDLAAAGVTTTDPGNSTGSTGKGPYYSSDYRLSKMDTLDLGLKLVWKVNDWFSCDASYDRYFMHGRDGVTPASAYVDANVFSFGVKLSR